MCGGTLRDKLEDSASSLFRNWDAENILSVSLRKLIVAKAGKPPACRIKLTGTPAT